MSSRPLRTNVLMVGQKTSPAAREGGFAGKAIAALSAQDLEALTSALEQCPALATGLSIIETKSSGTVVLGGGLSAFVVKKGWAKALDVLWKHGDRFQDKLESSNLTVAAYAAKKGKVSCLRRMLKLGLDLNMPKGFTPLTGLTESPRHCDYEKAKQALDILLDAGADPYAPHRNSSKSIALAAIYGTNLEAATRMLERTKDAGKEDADEWMLAWMNGYSDFSGNPDQDIAFLETLHKKGLIIPSPEDLCHLWGELDDASPVSSQRRPQLEHLIKWRMDLCGYDKEALAAAIGKIGTPAGLGEVRSELVAESLHGNTLKPQGSLSRPRL